jgi:hypothetical protein
MLIRNHLYVIYISDFLFIIWFFMLMLVIKITLTKICNFICNRQIKVVTIFIIDNKKY